MTQPILQPTLTGGPSVARETPGILSAGVGLWSLTWLHLLNDGAANYLPAVLPAVVDELHIPRALVGAVMGGLLVGQGLQPLCGWIADRLGGRLFVVLGATGTTIGAALIGLMPSYFWLVGLLLVIGTANAFFHPPALTAVRQLDSRRHAVFISTFLIGGELGRGLWPLLAGALVTHFGLPWLALLALPTVLTMPFLAGRVPALVVSAARRPRGPGHGVSALGRLAAVLAYAGLRASVLYSVVTFLPLLWRQRGGSLVGGAWMITVFLCAGIAGNIGGGLAAERFGRRAVLATAPLLSAALIAVLVGIRGPALWVVLALLGVASWATIPLQILIAQDLLPDNRSLGSGLALGFSNALGAAGLAVLGWVAARTSIPVVLWIGVALNLGAAMLLSGASWLPAQSQVQS